MIGDLVASIRLAGGVVDLAKNIKDLSEKTGNLELKEAAVELRSKTIDLKEIVNDLRNRINDLEKQLEFKDQLTWNGKTFEYEKDGKTAYVCSGCEANKKYTHMSEINNDRGYHAAKCPACSNEVIFNSGQPPKVVRRVRHAGWMGS
jgi:DNA-directed RNA polymerase subunit RPC12/RpoP